MHLNVRLFSGDVAAEARRLLAEDKWDRYSKAIGQLMLAIYKGNLSVVNVYVSNYKSVMCLTGAINLYGKYDCWILPIYIHLVGDQI